MHVTGTTSPGRPRGIALNPAERTACGARVRDTTGATRYQIKLSTETRWTNGKERYIRNLTPGTTYTVQGRAGNSNGWGPSVSASYTTLAA